MLRVVIVFVISFIWLQSYSQQINIPFRLNIGSKEEFKTADGKVFLSDPPDKPNPYIVGGGGFISKEGVVEGGGIDRSTNTYTNYTRKTVDPEMEIYNSERWSGGKEDHLKFAFPVPNGKYDVITYHSEGYFGAEFSGRTNDFSYSIPEGLCVRVFDVSIENTIVQKHFDVFEIAGAAQVGVKLKFSAIEVVDGVLNIELIKSRNSYTGPSINAIEILAVDPSNEGSRLIQPFGVGTTNRIVELKAGSSSVNETFLIPDLYNGLIYGQIIEINKGQSWEKLTWDGFHEYKDNMIRIRNVSENFNGFRYRTITKYSCTERYSQVVELRVMK